VIRVHLPVVTTFASHGAAALRAPVTRIRIIGSAQAPAQVAFLRGQTVNIYRPKCNNTAPTKEAKPSLITLTHWCVFVGYICIIQISVTFSANFVFRRFAEFFSIQHHLAIL